MEKRDTIFKKYLTCINRASTALVCSAHYLDMKTPEDIILNLMLSILGFLGFVYLLAQFSQLITTFHSRSKRYMKLVEQLQEYMRHKELPQSLQRQLLAFYNYWIRKGFERDKKIISQVSPYLREELILHNYLQFIDNVKLLKHLPEMVVARLATFLRPEIFMPGDIIVEAGTCGNALYFVASGTVAVYTSSGKEVCHLEDGAYFGEIALVMENEHRTATIIAVETCEIYVLSRADFRRVLAPYPDLLSRSQNLALQHLERAPLLDDTCDFETMDTSMTLNISSIKGKRKD
ncbi:hypothetical protein KM043_018167 [Ampulex compressa]|nr:hypothetical protein KM043_018167 [Ampulex compressa]